MNVLLVMDPFIRVPPNEYGGIERVVADLAEELVRRGHHVTLWAAPGSNISGRVQPFGREGEWTRWSNVRNIVTLAARFAACPKRFDIVHNFGRLAYLAPILPVDLPKIQTYMRTVNPANMIAARRLGAKRLHYTAVSAAIRDTARGGRGDWSVIYNCAAAHRYPFSPAVDPQRAPLVFLGRLERCKGAHHAITVAERLNRQLLIAGNVSSLPEERAYFEREIRPRVDGGRVRYIGPVDDAVKRVLLGEAAALLMPIEWEEPFPVVLPEAMLCGTPVIAFKRGGVPEGIDDGRTGFLCDSVGEMAVLVRRIGDIDRRTVRDVAVQRFSDAAVVDAYESLYQRVC